MSRESDAAKELAALRSAKKGVGKTTLGLDPGTAATGVAVVRDGELVFCNVLKATGSGSKDRLPSMCARIYSALMDLYKEWQPDVVAIEWQAIRPGDPRPNDILHMAMVNGAALAVPRSTFSKLLLPLPVSWKGSISGDIFTRRVENHFPKAAQLLTANRVADGIQHNGLDAAGLAAWAINERLPWSR